MRADRRQFSLGLTTTLFGLGMSQGAYAQKSDSSAGGSKPTHHYFFKDPTFEMIFLTSLGRAYHCGGNVGKVLYLTRQVEDGNFESAYLAFMQAGDEARQLAEGSASHGHKESARQAYLWAQNFYDSATYFVDGSKDPTRFLATWESLYACWLKAMPLFEPAIEPVKVPYENTELHGFFLRGAGKSKKRPLLILSNGSDGSLLDMWLWGGAGALARGYDCLMFDGPGQGYALWKQKLYFRPDWEKVISPVVDYAVSRSDVDPKRIAIQGISQGGYWVPRAVAFEKRIAAAIADPGVVDVSTSWTASLPPPLLALLNAGRKAEFDGFLAKALSPGAKANLNFRMRPFGFSSYFDTYKAVSEYNLRGVADRITCPLLITAPANETYWPGQSQQLYDLVKSPKMLVHFSESDGADLHCEPKGTGLRDLHVFNWLDQTLR
ncbi:prolyl oligopeptidase family serine peptidase [Granulicella sp. dw_53]|uniref:alpha/beta hydrolase family protein n=1 Tax=Granulicella sp. dw_53 TaxID=2719792 RepID=UPI001BD69F7E|nr:prolyl oligopeptidase family serine peptidase [Granulicella sp. dw_53]